MTRQGVFSNTVKWRRGDVTNIGIHCGTLVQIVGREGNLQVLITC